MSKKENLNSQDWRKVTLEKNRKLINETDPEIVEERKYKMPSNPYGIPVWYNNGMICTGETYKNHLRLTFSKGTILREQAKNSIFNRHSAIVIKKDDKIDEDAFKDLIRKAVELNKYFKKH